MTRPVVPSPITDTVAPLGPNARAMMEDARCRGCGHRSSEHGALSRQCYARGALDIGVCSCNEFFIKQPSPRPTVANLIADIAAGIRVLVTRDKLDIPEELIMERARNTAMGIVGNYNVTGMGE